MAISELTEWNGWCPSHLNIVLLGGRNSGKSHVGNLILSKEEFATQERSSCCRRLGVVAGRRVAVVDTPSWWCDFSVQNTPELVKREIMSSVPLCSPGPHAFLITVKASSSFTEKRRRALEEHVRLLGDRVWRHCIAVFTYADTRGDTGSETKALNWLSEKCGHRCHSMSFSDDAEIAQLFQKIDRLVAKNGNRVFEMQEITVQEITEKKREADSRAQQRFLKMRKQRCLMQEKLRYLPDIRMVLLGAKGSGKTSALNTILGSERSHGLRRTAQCLVGKGFVLGRQVTAVDTPGWWMNYFHHESSFFERREMMLSVSLCPPGPHVFLLLIRLDRAFTETYRRAVQEHLELVSKNIWSHVLLLFSFGDWLGDTTVEQLVENEGEPLRWLVEKCGNRYHVLNFAATGDDFQVRGLIRKMEEMVCGCNSGRYFEMELGILEQLQEEKQWEKERAMDRFLKKDKQRQTAKSQLGKIRPLSEFRILLVGGRSTGKSSCGNTILSRESFHSDKQTTSCSEKCGKIGGKTLVVADTPGSVSLTSDLLETPPPSGFTAILLIVNMSSSFTHSQRRAVENQLDAGGAQMWSRAMVLFSYGDWLGDTTIEQRIESEGPPLQALVRRCGNRYHVLNNKTRRNRGQVEELLQLIEEMVVEERLNVHAGNQREKISSGQQQQPDGAKQHLNSSHELTEALGCTASSLLHCSQVADVRGQMMPLRGGRGRRRRPPQLTILDGPWMSRVTSVLSDKERPTDQQRLVVNLHVWSTPDHLHNLRVNGTSQVPPFSPTHPSFPQMQIRIGTDGEDSSVQSPCHPALTERTLRSLTEQWGDSSLEELEAFIDSYFEMLWEQAVGSLHPAQPSCTPAEQVTEAGDTLLLSIDRKLSKLDLLEEIQMDLAELRRSLVHSWNVKEELKDSKRKQDAERGKN
ncbi:GTPase IMAP family member 8 [Thalassophryne amazonica]|uniref:GTPase IMAP family member 8 n=1 Tax=Thalassophryne amazonica TaxID=390379 RepID=UPI0014723731|nr:GTPase IMAP family member 8 [Thalassophryne amazonica]